MFEEVETKDIKTNKNNQKKEEDFFNPVKVDESGKMARRMIWSTKSIDAALKGIREGRQLIASPFYMGNIKLLKPDLNFKRTPEEIEDFIKCKNDILYFAKKCKLMTPEGIEYITLRDYQEDYLRHLEKNQLSIFLSCRQSGKCFSPVGRLLLRLDENSCLQVKKEKLKDYFISDNIYDVPVFEIYNLYDTSFKWKIKYRLYKIIYKLQCRAEKLCQKIHGNE